MKCFVTLNYNQQENTIKSIQSNIEILLKENIDFKYYVVDNGSHNEQESLKKFCISTENVHYIKKEDNFGVCEAFNYAIEEVYNNSEFIIRIDNDVFLQPSFSINEYFEYMLNHKIAISGPTVLGRDGQFQSGQIKISKFGNNSIRLNSLKPVISDTILGCFMIFNTNILSKEYCKFDEFLKFGSEELEICLRAKKSQKLIVYNPNYVIIHMDGTTTNSKKEIWNFTSYLLIRNNEVVLRRYSNYLTSIVRILYFTIYHLIRAIIKQDTIQIRAYLSGIFKNKITKSEWKKLDNFFQMTQHTRH